MWKWQNTAYQLQATHNQVSKPRHLNLRRKQHTLREGIQHKFANPAQHNCPLIEFRMWDMGATRSSSKLRDRFSNSGTEKKGAKIPQNHQCRTGWPGESGTNLTWSSKEGSETQMPAPKRALLILHWCPLYPSPQHLALLDKHLPPPAPPRNIIFDGKKLTEPNSFRPLPISNECFLVFFTASGPCFQSQRTVLQLQPETNPLTHMKLMLELEVREIRSNGAVPWGVDSILELPPWLSRQTRMRPLG